MGAEAMKAITSQSRSRTAIPEGPFLASDQAFSMSNHTSTERTRARVVQDRQSIERFNDLASRLAIQIFQTPSPEWGVCVENDDTGQYQGGEEELMPLHR